MSILSVLVFLVVYSSLYNGNRCLDVLCIMKGFVENKSVGLPPSIFVGMVVYGPGESDEDDEKQGEDSDDEDPGDPVVSVDDPEDIGVDPIQVKDEPVENMDVPEPPEPDEDYRDMDVEHVEDSQDEEMSTSEEDSPRPTYVPFDPENEFGYSTFL